MRSRPELHLHEDDMRRIVELVCREFGITIPVDKRALVLTRIRPLVYAANCQTVAQWLDRFEANLTRGGLQDLANRISTNHTYFFREKSHFENYRDRILPELLARPDVQRQKDLRVWCAAASTGEEPYTLALLQREVLAARGSDVRGGLLATDISTAALAVARRGVYPKAEVEKLPPLYRDRYFDRVDHQHVRASAELRRDVTFRRFNLNEDVYPFRNGFHAIFCRNVMIYFSDATITEVVKRMEQALVPGGYLFVGHAESLDRIDCGLEQVDVATYRRPVDGAGRRVSWRRGA